MSDARQDVLAEARSWDAVTAATVLGRLEPTVGLSFFTPAQGGVLAALARLLLADPDPVPVAHMIDARLARGDTDGWHHDAMPDERTTWRQSLDALDTEARSRHQHVFALCSEAEQTAIVHEVQARAKDGEVWYGLPAGQLWGIWMRFLCTAYYAHPSAWDEIGFPGPAYPRGYKNLGLDAREPFERPAP